MYLINASKLKLEHFTSDLNLPLYAIISHRWEKGEVLFSDIGTWSARTRRGYSKLVSCCKQALRDGFTHVWMDTCCIDKASSAELSEAINSMYQWYKRASICYAYLCDVTRIDDFGKSVWFTRSWTLQELLAPADVIFFDRNWVQIGTKSDLRDRLHKITNISLGALKGQSLQEFSVAQRMCWASKRYASRVEDRAYSLMGIFNVNMPMLYGEGERAFIRLQEEIVKTCHDHSIFAWKARWNHPTGLLASSPSLFKDSDHIVVSEPFEDPESYSLTSLGLSIKLSLVPWAMETYLALLECCHDSCERSDPQEMYGVLLRLTNRDWEYVRLHSRDSLMVISGENLAELKRGRLIKRVYVPPYPKEEPLNIQYGLKIIDRIASEASSDQGVPTLMSPSAEHYQIEKEFLIQEGNSGTAGTYVINSDENSGFGKQIILKMGFDDDFCPLLMLTRFNCNSRGSSRLSQHAYDLLRRDVHRNRWIYRYTNASGDDLKSSSLITQWESHELCYISLRRNKESYINLDFLGISIHAQIDWVRNEGSMQTFGWVISVAKANRTPAFSQNTPSSSRSISS